MRTRCVKVVATIFPLVVAVAVFAVTVGGPWYILHLPMGEHGGAMVGCPLAGTMTLCPMNVVSHLAMWHGVFTVAVQEVTGSLLALLAVPLVVWFLTRLQRWLSERVRKRPRDVGKWYVRQHPARRLYAALRQAFATGIPQPKVFPADVF